MDVCCGVMDIGSEQENGEPSNVNLSSNTTRKGMHQSLLPLKGLVGNQSTV